MALLDQPLSDRLPGFDSTVEEPAGRHYLPSLKLYRHGGKRLFDGFVVLVTMPFWLPIVLMTACLVALDGHNPFYTQKRIGRDGRVFSMIKLRSMAHDADAIFEAHLKANPAARAEWQATQKLKNDPRVTHVGRFIRKTSIDELPQLFNVLAGQMSLVGPRPMMLCQKRLYPGQRYYDLRPGLTGFWQISNRNHCRFAGRARYDNAYFDRVSLPTDLAVIWRTVGVVLRGTGY